MNANSKYPTSNECCHDDMPDYYNIIIYNKDYCEVPLKLDLKIFDFYFATEVCTEAMH